MGANRRSALDPRWTKHHVAVVASFMLARIRVFRKNPGTEPVYDQVTKKWTGSYTEVWQGAARIQPYGIIGDQIVGQDTTGRRLMRVQIKDKLTGINLDDMIEITECLDDPELTTFSMEVRGTIGSSNSWVTDLVCEADLKHVMYPDQTPKINLFPNTTEFPGDDGP